MTWAALRDAGPSSAAAGRLAADLRCVHNGVYLTGYGQATPHQRRLAATLTAPGTVPSHASAGEAWGFLAACRGGLVAVTRPGTGGPKRVDGLIVRRSRRLAGDVTELDGVPITSAPRTLVDLSIHLGPRQRAKAVREAIRLRRVTALELRLAVVRHRGRRGVVALGAVAAALESLPIERARSDAEARALEVLVAAGLPTPRANARIAGIECDLSWPEGRLVVEVDGPQFHRDAAADAWRQGVVERAGWRVERIGSGAVFDEPERLVALVRGALEGAPDPLSVHLIPPGGTW